MASILPNGRVQFIDQNGKPLVGGSVTFYAPGTTTKKDTYQDSAMTEPNTNPVLLDSRGQATIWGNGSYRQVVQDVLGVTIWDQVVSASASTDDLASSAGAGMIGLPDGSSLSEAISSNLSRTLTSIAALRATPKQYYTKAFCTGYRESMDGGGGPYEFDPDDTSSADNGGSVIVGNDGARWKLTHYGSVSICQFGANEDVADNTDFLTAATNSGIPQIEVPVGTFVHKLFTPAAGVRMLGKGGTLKAAGGEYAHVLLPSNCASNRFIGLVFDGVNLTPDGDADECGCIVSPAAQATGAVLNDLLIDDCQFINISVTVGKLSHAVQLHYGDARVTNCYVQQAGGDALNFNNGKFVVIGNRVFNGVDGGIAFNNNAVGIIVGNYISRCDLGIGAGPEGTSSNPDYDLTITGNGGVPNVVEG